ncbi:MAG: hypothetical protein O3B82_01725 [Bacteroidetes bacterium]|nr:hypothetical protein [Bacteroidota bacterium]
MITKIGFSTLFGSPYQKDDRLIFLKAVACEISMIMGGFSDWDKIKGLPLFESPFIESI